MIVLEFPKIFIVILDWSLEEEQLKCKFQLELIKKEANIQVLSNFHSKQVNFTINIVGYALEIIPKTLATNCGVDVVKIITELRAKHAVKGNSTFGIDGNAKKITDMSIVNIWEPIAVKNQVIKTAIEASCLLLRIDDVVSGVKRREKQSSGPQNPGEEQPPNETFGDARDG